MWEQHEKKRRRLKEKEILIAWINSEPHPHFTFLAKCATKECRRGYEFQIECSKWLSQSGAGSTYSNNNNNNNSGCIEALLSLEIITRPSLCIQWLNYVKSMRHVPSIDRRIDQNTCLHGEQVISHKTWFWKKEGKTMMPGNFRGRRLITSDAWSSDKRSNSTLKFSSLGCH